MEFPGLSYPSTHSDRSSSPPIGANPFGPTHMRLADCLELEKKEALSLVRCASLLMSCGLRRPTLTLSSAERVWHALASDGCLQSIEQDGRTWPQTSNMETLDSAFWDAYGGTPKCETIRKANSIIFLVGGLACSGFLTLPAHAPLHLSKHNAMHDLLVLVCLIASDLVWHLHVDVSQLN